MTIDPMWALTSITRDDEVVEAPERIKVHPLIGAQGLINSLSDNQQQFLTMKLHGGTDAAAARLVGISPTTVMSWKKQDDFRLVYDMVVNSPVQIAAEATAFGVAKAIDRILDLLDSPNIKHQQWAIEKLLALGRLNTTQIDHTVRYESEVNDGDIDSIIERIERRRIDAGADGRGDAAV